MEKTLQLILEQLQQLNSRVSNVEGNLHELKEEMNSSFEKVNVKLDGLTEQIAQNTETFAFVKEQTTANTELSAPLTEAIARIDAMETDLKLMKKVITS